uniref:RRM domain-containing protein n=1 Tax=Fagus sylvatica TaxID=28930 RepID=A0A2N9GUX1_FAGSY
MNDKSLLVLFGHSKAGDPNFSRNSGGGGTFRTKKIFVGGLPPTLSEEGFRQHFEAYGHVTDVVVMYDQNTGRPRGFGFITFDAEEAVDRVLHKNFHDLNGKQVEVKRALPKDANPGGGNRTMGGAGGGGAVGSGYQSYGVSGGNPNSYDGRMDSSRYMQPQNTGGGFAPYGSSGYSTPGYGYGPASNGIGYGSYGSYAGANTPYGGPAGAAYGNPNVANAGYGSGPPGAPRSSWSTQSPSGSAPAGQSPSAATGYGNQGYGYGGYGGSDGSYGNPSGYGAVGGRSGSVPNNNAGGELQGSGGGYMGSGYGDPNGNTGYGNGAWRSDQSQTSGNYGAPQVNGPHGGQVGYGGYGSAQARAQQQDVVRFFTNSSGAMATWVDHFVMGSDNRSGGSVQRGMEFEDIVQLKLQIYLRQVILQPGHANTVKYCRFQAFQVINS